MDNPGMLNDPMGNVADNEQQYADFWNRILQDAGADNKSYHNYGDAFASSSGDVINFDGSNAVGYDVYVTKTGNIASISKNSGNTNNYYGWDPGQHPDGYYAVTGSLSASELSARLQARADIFQKNLDFRRLVNQQPDLAKPITVSALIWSLYELGLEGYAGYFTDKMDGETTVNPMPTKGAPSPSPNFKPPTNPPQPPPTEVPPGYVVRVMPPTQQYPDGYWVLEKPMPQGGFQKIDPSTMQPGTKPETHVPLPPNYEP